MTPDKPEANVDHLRFHRKHAHLAPTFGNDTFALKAEAFARFFGTPTMPASMRGRNWRLR